MRSLRHKGGKGINKDILNTHFNYVIAIMVQLIGQPENIFLPPINDGALLRSLCIRQNNGSICIRLQKYLLAICYRSCWEVLFLKGRDLILIDHDLIFI